MPDDQKKPDLGLQVQAPAFNIIKNKGRPQRATLHDNVIVERVEWIDIPGLRDKHPRRGTRFPCIDYDTHFVYQHPATGNFFCTCGAPAVVILPTEGIPTGYFWHVTCTYDANTGFRGLHQTSVLNKRDFKERRAGTTMKPDEWMPG